MSSPPATPLQLALRRAALASLALAGFVALLMALGTLTSEGAALADRLTAEARLAPLGAGIAVLVLTLPLTAVRWRTLLGPESRAKAPITLLTGLLCAGFVINTAMPGPAGDALAVFALRKKAGTSLAEGFGSLTVGRIFGLGAAALVAGLSGLFIIERLPPEWVVSLQVAAGLLVLAAVVIAAIVLWPRLPGRVALGLVDHIQPRLPPAAAEKLGGARPAIEKVFDDLTRAARLGPARLLAAWGWSLAVHVSTALGMLLVAVGLGVELSLASALFAYTGTVTGSVALFVLPGSLTGFDVLLTALLDVAGPVPLAESIAIVGFIRIEQTFITLLGAGALFAMFRAWLPDAVPTSPEPDAP